MTYNLTFMDNVTNPLTMVSGVNTESGGVLFISLLFIFWLVLYVSFGNFALKDRFLASSFIVTIGGGLLLGAGLLEWWILVFPALATLVGLIYKLWSD